MTNKPYFLALNRIDGIGPRTALKLLARWPNLAELFALTQAEMLTTGLSPNIANALCSFNLNKIDEDFHWAQTSAHHHLLTWDNKDYPVLLREIHDPPLVLYAQGDLTCLKQPALAIVGTRNPSITGKETAKRFAYELAQQGINIISGLALGIDAQAHIGCLEAQGKTTAVMGTGIDRIYPFRHRDLAKQISEQGLVLSEFPLKTAPNAGHFPRRNRIISGLSSATLVVEAAIKSGSLITARLALEQNRDVLAIPSSIHNPQARGCHHLLQQGAKLVTSTNDILETFDLVNLQKDHIQQVPSLACSGENLVKCIGYEVTTIDQIAFRSELSLEEVACELATLELKGIITAVPGGYIRCI